MIGNNLIELYYIKFLQLFDYSNVLHIQYVIYQQKMGFSSFNLIWSHYMILKNFTCPHFIYYKTWLWFWQGEIELMRRLNHPHIVEYYETIRTEGYLNIVLEYVTLINIYVWMDFSQQCMNPLLLCRGREIYSCLWFMFLHILRNLSECITSFNGIYVFSVRTTILKNI